MVYDDGPGTAAARLWWLLRDYGHDDVLVLDGGLAAWAAAGRPVSTEPVTPPSPATGPARPGRLPVVDADDVPAAVAATACCSTSGRPSGSAASTSRSTRSPATSRAPSTPR